LTAIAANYFVQNPNVIENASFHRWRDAQTSDESANCCSACNAAARFWPLINVAISFAASRNQSPAQNAASTAFR
jgi:hypothetical protein